MPVLCFPGSRVLSVALQKLGTTSSPALPWEDSSISVDPKAVNTEFLEPWVNWVPQLTCPEQLQTSTTPLPRFQPKVCSTRAGPTKHTMLSFWWLLFLILSQLLQCKSFKLPLSGGARDLASSYHSFNCFPESLPLAYCLVFHSLTSWIYNFFNSTPCPLRGEKKVCMFH